MFSLKNNLTKDSNILKVRVKNYGECGYCSNAENKAILNIPWHIWSQWLYVSQHMGSKEWGAVFWVKDDTITSFKIPKQEVTSIECEFKEELGGDGIVHSHHNMDAFHSSQDDLHARNLYCYSIVLSNTKGYEATKRIKLPCRGFGYVNLELQLSDRPDIDFSKITEKKQELVPETYHKNHQEELGFGADESPCSRCEGFECKTCKFAIGRGREDMPPFCDYCGDYDFCDSCKKLAKYLDNYPEERKSFEYLYAGEI